MRAMPSNDQPPISRSTHAAGVAAEPAALAERQLVGPVRLERVGDAAHGAGVEHALARVRSE